MTEYPSGWTFSFLLPLLLHSSLPLYSTRAQAFLSSDYSATKDTGKERTERENLITCTDGREEKDDDLLHLRSLIAGWKARKREGNKRDGRKGSKRT